MNRADYALSISDSNSASNILLVCGDCLKPAIDEMVVSNTSIDVQYIGDHGDPCDACDSTDATPN